MKTFAARVATWWRARHVRCVRDLRPTDVGRYVELFPLPTLGHWLEEGELTRVEHYEPDMVQLGVERLHPYRHADEPWEAWIQCRIVPRPRTTTHRRCREAVR